MPTPRFELAAAIVSNATGQPVLYAIGGLEDTGDSLAPSSRVEAYNTVSNTWVRRKSLPERRAGLKGAGVIDGEIYVVGGTGSGARGQFFTKTLYIYHPGRNTWRRGADLPVRDASSFIGVIGRKLYVLTGLPTGEHRLFRYDPATNLWSPRAGLPRFHQGGAAAVVGGKLFVVWGSSPTVDMYDPVTDTWTLRLTMTQEDFPRLTVRDARTGEDHGPFLDNGTAVPYGQRLLVIGGTIPDNDPNDPDITLADTYMYDPAANAWSQAAALNQIRSSAAAGTLRTSAGRLWTVVVGGRREFGPGHEPPFQIQGSTELLTP